MYVGIGFLDSRNAEMLFAFLSTGLLSSGGTKITITDTCSPAVPPRIEKNPLVDFPPFFQEVGSPGTLKVSLSETGDIQPRTLPPGSLGVWGPDTGGIADDSSTWTLRWNNIKAEHPPDPKAAR